MIGAITNFNQDKCRPKTRTHEATITPTVPILAEIGKREEAEGCQSCW